jgi:tetrahydromethanopterin S-methyltransferase subunit F
MSAFSARLEPGPRLIFERVILSMAQAAETLPMDAAPEEIRDRSRLIRRRRL